MRRVLAGMAIMTFLAVAAVVGVLGDIDVATAQTGSAGADVYAASCAGCHQSDGSGVPGAFPPLADNPNAVDAAYVEDVVRNGLSGPIEVLGVGYDSAMPAIPLDDAEIAAVVGFVQSLAGADDTPTTTTTGPTAQPVGPDGEQLYNEACAGCHQLDGSGVSGTFPPLADNPNAADGDYVADVIRNGLRGPIEVLGVSYDTAMPSFPLDDAQVAAIVDYVRFLATGEPAATTTTSAAPSSTAALPTTETPGTTTAAPDTGGDVENGEKLFTGALTFSNGGPACHACHSAGAIGLGGGSGLGPDLTAAGQTYGGETGLTAWLLNPPSPTMRPLFADEPLTESEAGDVAAFLDSVQTVEADTGADVLTLGGLVGFIALLVLMVVFIRRPRAAYADRLRRRA